MRHEEMRTLSIAEQLRFPEMISALERRSEPRTYSCPYTVHDVTPIWSLSSIRDDDFKVGVLEQYLLYSAIITISLSFVG